MRKLLHMGERDYVLTAWPERASGPGWSNRPLWVVVGTHGSNVFRRECLQPQEYHRIEDVIPVLELVEAAHHAITGPLARATTPKRSKT